MYTHHLSVMRLADTTTAKAKAQALLHAGTVLHIVSQHHPPLKRTTCATPGRWRACPSSRANALCDEHIILRHPLLLALGPPLLGCVGMGAALEPDGGDQPLDLGRLPWCTALRPPSSRSSPPSSLNTSLCHSSCSNGRSPDLLGEDVVRELGHVRVACMIMAGKRTAVLMLMMHKQTDLRSPVRRG